VYALRHPEDWQGVYQPGSEGEKYWLETRALIVTDTGRDTKTVVEDLQAVPRRIEHWHQGSLAHLDLTVIDLDGGNVS
jgi:hypothetical protein